ncbi:MAG: type II toxin-antitoxin system RelE/ParE family toxin [Pseudomonadota bacterium]
MRLVWTPPAIRDLQSLRNYIAQDKPSAAGKQVKIILTAVAGLSQFPESGRPGRKAGTRELVIGKTPYLAIYRNRNERLEILRILHGRQSWNNS